MTKAADSRASGRAAGVAAAAPAAPARRDAAAMLLLVVLGAAMQAPWIATPLTGTDHTAGVYYGLFALCYQRFGFWALRGMPLWPQLPASPETAAALYQNHPPLHFWLAGAFGMEEWHLRLPTVVGAVLASLGLFWLLRRRLATWWAFGGAALFLAFPVNVLLCQASLELAVMPCAIWLLLATAKVLESDGTARRRWRAVQAAAAFLGPWMDWPFAWFCVALVPLAWGRRGWRLALLVPGLASLAAVAAVLAWRWWATANPAFAAIHIPGHSVADLVDATILKRPDTARLLERGLQFLLADYTRPALWLGLAALPWLAVRAPRAAAALLLPPLLHVFAFADHAAIHVHFWAYFGPALAVAATALLAAVGTAASASAWLRRGAALALALLVGNAVVASQRWWQHASTTYFRDLGAALTEAAVVRDARGEEAGSAVVVHNCHMLYTYYLRSPNVFLEPMTRAELLAGALATTAAAHARYLWIRTDDAATNALWTSPELEQFLAGFPRQRLPQLEVDYGTHVFGVRRRILEAWLYELKAPK